MINPKQSRIPAWLLWATTKNGLVTLASITLNQTRAITYKEIIEQDTEVVTVKIEKTEANHLFHPDWEEQWQNAYGTRGHLEDYADRKHEILKLRCECAEYERDKAQESLALAQQRIKELALKQKDHTVTNDTIDIQLIPIDMNLSVRNDHPQIEVGKQYLVKLRKPSGDGYIYYAGTFSRQWFGLNFDGWTNPAGLQFDKPCADYSRWVQVWEIQEINNVKN